MSLQEIADGEEETEKSRVVDVFTAEHEGNEVDCLILAITLNPDKGEAHYVGYVSIPPALLGEVNWQQELEANGGITYGPDDDGWIGFDCAHSWDRCVDENGEPLPGYHGIGEDAKKKTWSPKDVKHETQKLGVQVLEFYDE